MVARSYVVHGSGSQPKRDQPTKRRTAPPLRVVLLGGFRVERVDRGRPLGDWQRRTAKALIKLLGTCPGHALHRELILEYLWPRVDIESALNSFGKALHAARRALEPELLPRESSAYLRLTDSMLAMNTEHVEIDADHFEQLAQVALRCREVRAYESALAAYGGELLPEDRYEDWCADRRTFLAELHARLLLAMAEALEDRGAYNESADCTRRVLQQDATREEVHRRLMRLYAKMGTPDQSVRQFHLCEEVLRRDLDLTPQHETVALYKDVLASRVLDRSSTPERDRGPVVSHQLPIPEPTTRGPFVGREQLFALMCDQLARGDERKAGIVLLSGEPGIGKTRLLEEFAIRATRQGDAVLWGGSGAHASQFAYGPFAVAFEGYAASRSEAERNELAQRYPALAPFVPSLGTNSQPARLADDARDDHLDLVPAIVRLLTDLGRRQSVVLVLGDLHDVDPSSLDLLRYLAHLAVARRWLMLGAVRDEELEPGSELQALIDATTRERLCLKIDLQCLSRQECDEFVLAMLPGASVRDDVLQQIYSRSRGNPLFIEELVRDLGQSGELAFAGGDRRPSPWVLARVPARVRALARMRLARMDATGREVLALAAAASATEVSLSELRAGAAALELPISDQALFDALDHALQMRLLEERKSGYAFRHPLMRSALYQELPLHRRDQLQSALGRVGSAPEQRWKNRPSRLEVRT